MSQNGFFQREDLGPGLIMGGLSMLANNDGRMNTAQLIGQGGLDALASLQFRKKLEAERARQAELDAMNQQKHDLAMRQGQMQMDEAARRAELERLSAGGDENAIRALAPLEWWKAQQGKQAATLAHQRALELEKLKQGAKGKKGTYDSKLGGYVFEDGSFEPVIMPEGYKNPKAEAQEEQKQRSGNIVLEDVNRLRAKIKDYFVVPNVGAGSVLKRVPGTNAADVASLIEGLGANIAFDKLNEMRAASPTGGALGNVTEGEQKRLSAIYGSLSQAQSEEQFLENLDRLEREYANIVHGAGNWRVVDGQIVVGKPEMVTKKPGNRGTGKRYKFNPETGEVE